MKSGIYKITNIINNKCYVGSAKNIKQRWQKHKQFLRRKIHHSIALQRAWNKYKINNFQFDVVEYVEDIKTLIQREQHYFDTLKPEYNTCKIAGYGGKLGIKSSKKEIERKRLAWTGENNPNFGGMSEEHRQNISKSRIEKGTAAGENNPRYGCKLDDETKQKIAKKLKGRIPWNKRK